MTMSVLFVICASILAILVSILWILLPFAVFGIKKRLDALILLQQQALDAVYNKRS